jgi:uncharacterized protein HemY
MDSLRKAAVLTPVAQRAGISLELARRLEENGLIDEAQRMVDQALQADPESKLARELERVLRRDRELAPYLEAPQAK